MYYKRTLVSCAISTALGLATSAADATTINSWQLGDVLTGDNTAIVANGSDGKISGFLWFQIPTGEGPYNSFGSTGELCGGSPCAPIAMDGTAIGTNIFTTGFTWSDGTPALPYVTTGGILADITGTTLTFTAFNMGLDILGTQFYLEPNVLANCTGQAGCGTSSTMGYEAMVVPAGAGTWNVRVRFHSLIDDGPYNIFNGYEGNWRLEGTMSAVPVPTAAYLLGSGLVGLASIARRKVKRES